METNVVGPLALLGGTGMILVALGFTGAALVRHMNKGYLALGALLWVITVAVKIALAIPLNPGIYTALTGALPGGTGELLFELHVGALTGITEVAIVWLIMRYTRLGRVDWNHALAFGIGFGAIEALLLGLGSFAAVIGALVAPQTYPPALMDALAGLNNPLMGIAPIVERFFTIWVHILSNALIFFGVARLQIRWFWLAFAFKSAIDAWAAWGQLSGRTSDLGMIWTLEALVIVWGIIGWWGTRWISARYPVAGEPPAHDESPALAQAGT